MSFLGTEHLNSMLYIRRQKVCRAIVGNMLLECRSFRIAPQEIHLGEAREPGGTCSTYQAFKKRSKN